MKRITLAILAVLVVGGAAIWFINGSKVTEEAAPIAATPSTTTTAAAPAEVAAPAAVEPVAAVPATVAAEPARIELAQADFSGVEALGFVEGRHYQRLSPTQSTRTSANQVEVDEFFMYSCIHCFNLEPYVQAWLPTKPDYINFVHVPTTWNPTVSLHAQAFYAAEALGKGEEMHQPFFNEMHLEGNYLDTPAKLAQFFGRFDVSREDFESVFDSFAVHTKVNRASELGNRYRVDSTPTIIVNGKYKTSVGEAGGYDQLFQLIEALAAAELGQ